MSIVLGDLPGSVLTVTGLAIAQGALVEQACNRIGPVRPPLNEYLGDDRVRACVAE